MLDFMSERGVCVSHLSALFAPSEIHLYESQFCHIQNENVGF